MPLSNFVMSGPSAPVHDRASNPSRTEMNSNRRPILIDTDTASDDAVALIMALRSPNVEVKAITTVAGNVAVTQATRNALFTVELCGADVPVFSGARKPLERELQTADWFHGRDGLGDHGYAPSV